MSLTPRLLFLLFLVALLACAGIWLGAPWNRVWLLPAGILILMLISEQWLTKRYQFRLARQLPRTHELGRVLQVGYQLSCLPKRAFQLELAEEMPSALEGGDWQERYQTNKSGELQFVHPRRARELMPIAFDVMHLRVLGVFGLSWWRRKLSAPASVKLVPQSLTQAERRQFTRETGEVSQRKSGQGLELITLREYTAGDAPRSIDWKASARAPLDTRGQPALKVRVMSEDQDLEITVMLDVSYRSRLMVGNMRKIDHDINLVSRLSQAALSAGDRLHFIAYADRPIVEAYNLRGDLGIRKLYALLSQLAPVAPSSQPMVAAKTLLQRLPRRTLLVSMSDLSDPQQSADLARALRLLARKHLPLAACTLDGELKALAKHSGSKPNLETWLQPSVRIAASELLLEAAQAREALRALGAVVVAAEPEQLDALVLRSYRDLRKKHAV